ncbi:MAG: aminotransferase class V-fold PLP-dependent enzyme, partial [Gemmatimonadota bacterium]
MADTIQTAGGAGAMTAVEAGRIPPLDTATLRRRFPVLDQEVHGHRLAYLDSAASSQKPDVVIDAVRDYYLRDHANVHRGAHTLAVRATDRYEEARRRMARFAGAGRADEIVFTRSTTESINLVAAAWGRANLDRGDVVLVTEMEHHSNL